MSDKETEPTHFCISIIAVFPEMFNPNINKKVHSGTRWAGSNKKKTYLVVSTGRPKAFLPFFCSATWA